METISNKMDKEIEIRGLSGLSNIGNTCYMNSALQCLSASNLFVSFLIKKRFVSDIKQNIIDELGDKEREKRKKKCKTTIDINDDSDNDSDVSIYLRDVKEKYYNSMTYNSYKLFKNMWKTNSVITPRTFKARLGKYCETFKGSKQQDSEEFINFLLNQIHDEIKCKVSLRYKNIPQEIVDYIKLRKDIYKEIKDEQDPDIIQKKLKEFYEFTERFDRFETIYKSLDYWDSYLKKNHSPIIDIFSGLFMGQITCTKCNKKSINFESFNILPLPIPDKASNLQDCLQGFSKTEVLDGDNKYNCITCKEHTVANKNMYLWDLPEHLIIQLKRFTNNGMTTRKNNDTIKFPLENLTFAENYHEYRPRNYSYNLYGVVYHMGSLSGGHYIAFTKNPLNNKWYRFNDSMVHHIPDKDIEAEIMNGGSYILFYKKNYSVSENSHDEVSSDDDLPSDVEDNL
jgi:ubiquitin carboxyl-terminal hydrolase 8